MFEPPAASGTTIPIEFPTDTGTVTYRFDTKVLPGAAWEALLLAHRPKHDGFDYDPDTFPPAAILASVTAVTVVTVDGDNTSTATPDFDTDDAATIWSTWPQWARTRLLHAIEFQNTIGPALGKRRGRGNATPAPETGVTT